MVFKTKFGGRGITKNGLTPELLVKAQKNRAARVQTIKNALTSVDLILNDHTQMFYKKNPNLLVPNGSLIMMREKSTLEVIQQLGEAGQLSMLQAQKIEQMALSRTEAARRATIIAQIKHNLNSMEF